VRIVGGKNYVVVAEQIDDHRQFFFVLGGDPALPFEIFARLQFARGWEAPLRHGVIHAMEEK